MQTVAPAPFITHMLTEIPSVYSPADVPSDATLVEDMNELAEVLIGDGKALPYAPSAHITLTGSMLLNNQGDFDNDVA
ncbi:MAG TPA: hypothetical protein VGN81_22065 [Pseudonocardiaceae bacterium]